MNGTLNFAIGLEASKFISGMSAAQRGLSGFSASVSASMARLAGVLGVAYGVGESVQAVYRAIGRGDALQDLSVRAGASVEALYKLEEGFKQIGLEAGSAAPMIMKLQRVIGSAEGRQALSVLGLSGQAMAGMDAAAQIEAVATALGRMDANSQAAAAYQLMGREGAANMLQIARSGGELSDAMRAVARDAEVWGRNAERMGRLADAVTAIRSRLQTLIAGLVGGLAPAITRILDYLNSLDFAGFGERLGSAIDTALNIFRSGQVFELVRLSLLAGFEAATNGLSKLLAAVMVAARSAFAALFAPGGANVRDLATLIADAAKSGLASAADMPTTGPAWRALTDFVASFATPVEASSRRSGVGVPAASLGGGWERPVSSLEKMGFVFDGGAAPTTDYSRRTAKATEKLVDVLSKPIKVTGDFGSVIVNEK